MSDQLVQILEGNTFVVSDDRGDIEASKTDPTGLFSFDTRFLSRWVLTVNGNRLTALSTDDMQYFQSRFFLVPGSGTVYVDAKLSVIRQREVADGFREALRALNHEDSPVDLTIRIDAASDFADLFEVKDALKKKGQYGNEVVDGCLVLRYTRETYVRETWITSSEAAQRRRQGADVHGHRARARRVEHRAGCRGVARLPGRNRRTARSGSAGRAAGACARTWRTAWRSGCRRCPRSSATGRRSGTSTVAA